VEVRSLALVTELALAATRGKVSDRGDYIVVERPDAPSWADGNYLALPHRPAQDELPRWIDVFRRELGTRRAIALRWNDPASDDDSLAWLRAAGFSVDRLDVLAATEVLAPPHALPMRALASGEMREAKMLTWNLADRHDEAYREFLRARSAWHSELVARGVASFWGAFDDSKLVASVGLVRLPPLARYQDVQTLPAYRRRGLAGALLAAAAREARTHDVGRFVIFAEPGDEAARVYTRIGFQRVERSVIARRTT
jgi:GNAT superfamily N-acetyltransferase